MTDAMLHLAEKQIREDAEAMLQENPERFHVLVLDMMM
jgi:hypothetical protein